LRVAALDGSSSDGRNRPLAIQSWVRQARAVRHNKELSMATAKKHTPRGLKQDRARVATSQPYEVAYEANKTGASKPAVKSATKTAGPTRAKIEKALKKP
jgi:hypothetical protein